MSKKTKLISNEKWNSIKSSTTKTSSNYYTLTRRRTLFTSNDYSYFENNRDILNGTHVGISSSNCVLEHFRNIATKRSANRRGNNIKDRIFPICHRTLWFSTKSPLDWITSIRETWCIATSNPITFLFRQLNRSTSNYLILGFVRKLVLRGLFLKVD